MALNKIVVDNIKSFDHFDISLGDFNVFIGGNASGKSNFISILKFFSNLNNCSYYDCLYIEGGIEFFRNLLFSQRNICSLKIESNTASKHIDPIINSTKDGFTFQGLDIFSKFYSIDIDYSFIDDISFKEYLKIYCSKSTFKPEEIELFFKNKSKEPTDYITFSHINGILRVYSSFKERIDSVLGKKKYPKSDYSIFNYPHFYIASLSRFDRFSFFDIDPRLSKKAIQITGKSKLDEDGSNLALVINRIIQKSQDKERLINILSDILPFIHNVATSSLTDRSMLFFVKEHFLNIDHFPSSLISDGTANLMALIIALFFDTSDVTIIEEPERSIHPSLIKKLIEMMKDASRKKQIIITTHNPEIVKYAGIENIYLITRNKKGISSIEKPNDSKKIKEFLKNDIGIDELYIDNILELK